MNISLDNLIKGDINIKKQIVNNEKSVQFHFLVILFLVAIVIYIAYFALVHKIFMIGFLIATLFMLVLNCILIRKIFELINNDVIYFSFQMSAAN